MRYQLLAVVDTLGTSGTNGLKIADLEPRWNPETSLLDSALRVKPITNGQCPGSLGVRCKDYICDYGVTPSSPADNDLCGYALALLVIGIATRGWLQPVKSASSSER